MEERNQNTLDLDDLSVTAILKKINQEDKTVADEVERHLESIAKVVDLAVASVKKGGRILYIGSGTSGKIGILDASECPPTYGVEDDLVQGIISGGPEAVSGWLEDTEDDEELAVTDLNARKLTDADLLIGLTASGNTPYVLSALRYAKEIGCSTAGILCRPQGKINEICDCVVALNVGPEVIMGSTRMKAGTAQKMVLNMISTTMMVKLGKTYSNLMVNVKPINQKLQMRVKQIVCYATGCELSEVELMLDRCGFDPKTAIVALKLGLDIETSEKLLEEQEGIVSKALELGTLRKSGGEL